MQNAFKNVCTMAGWWVAAVQWWWVWLCSVVVVVVVVVSSHGDGVWQHLSRGCEA